MFNRKGRTGRKRFKKHNAIAGSDSRDKKYDELLQWMKTKYNFRAKVLKVATFSGIGRGIQAKKTIHTGDPIISVPNHALIGVKQACNESFLIKSLSLLHHQDSTIKITGIQALCLFLIEERRKIKLNFNEKWSPYIKVLPEDFTHPLYWEISTLSLLPATLYQNGIKQRGEVEQKLKSINKFIQLGIQHGILRRICKSKSLFTELRCIITMDEYRWAWCCVNTRCVFSDHDSPSCTFIQQTKSDNYYLIPFLDLLNHSSNAQVKGEYNKDNSRFEIIALKNCKKHKQVFIHYGDHSNASLLMEYGFIALNEENINDVIPVTWEELMKLYKFDRALQLKMKSILNNFSIDKGWCYSHVGPSWSLITAIFLMEEVKKQNPTIVFNQGYFHKLTSLAMEKDTEVLQDTISRGLQRLSKSKIEFINQNILKCVYESEACKITVEKQHIDMVLSLWNVYYGIMRQCINTNYL